MLCVKGQVGKGTATKSAFWHANHKKILCLNPGLCTYVNSFQHQQGVHMTFSMPRHSVNCHLQRYAIVVHMHCSMIFSIPRNFASHLYNCHLQCYVIIVYMHYDYLIMFV